MPKSPSLAQLLDWRDPLDIVAAVPHAEPVVLLHSSAQLGYSGGVSLLAAGLEETVEASSFAPLEEKLHADGSAFFPAWFGYLGYGLRHDIETLPRDMPGWITTPDLWMGRFASIYRFDHAMRRLERFGPKQAWEDAAPAPPSLNTALATPLFSNMSRMEYESRVARIVERIRAGELYQANLTRKFCGMFTHEPDGAALFAALCRASPSPYSAMLRMEGRLILSSSPERFMTVSPTGAVEVRPIKGTVPRGPDGMTDARAAQALHASDKDRAENLMIVDLMRNDLSRCCEPCSVRTDALFEVTAHPHVHHLSSTVRGQLRERVTALGAVKACFPPGSMTGAPKIRAMEWCTKLEGQARGVYSGALGWFGGDGSADLSVVIRTLVCEGKKFEFQVGGGIVADSTPEGEWRETMAKARGIALTLGIPFETLEAL